MDNDILYEYRYPRSGTLRCLAMLVGDTPIPGKNHFRSFANTPCGVAFTHAQPESAPIRSLIPAPPRRKEKLVFPFMAQAESSLRFLAFFPIHHYNKTYHTWEEKTCSLMKISNRYPG